MCFRYDPEGSPEPTLKMLNTEIMVRMQEIGAAAVSDTTVRGRHCLRAALNNHRTTRDDLDILVKEVVRQGAAFRILPGQGLTSVHERGRPVSDSGASQPPTA